MKMRDKLTISEISKRTGLARNTVKRWLKAPGDVSPRYLRCSDATKLSAYEATSVMALKADAHRHKDGRRTARALFIQIRAQGYRGGYSAVTDFIRAWRSDLGKAMHCVRSDPWAAMSACRCQHWRFCAGVAKAATDCDEVQ